MITDILSFAGLTALVCFIFAWGSLASLDTLKQSMRLAAGGALICIIAAVIQPDIPARLLILICIIAGSGAGVMLVIKTPLSAIVSILRIFQSLTGVALLITAIAQPGYHITPIGIALTAISGAVIASAALVASLRLVNLLPRFLLAPFTGQHLINCGLAIVVAVLTIIFAESGSPLMLGLLTVNALLLGIGLILPIGTAAMPAALAMLYALTGFSLVCLGYTTSSSLLMVTGSIIGVSGFCYCRNLCQTMHYGIIQLLFSNVSTDENDRLLLQKTVKKTTPEETAFLLKYATSVIIVPGYGLAASGAHHAIRELTDKMIATGIQVRYALHPAAGRMPNHLELLLTEAGEDNSRLFDMETINPDFKHTDIVLLVGANDICNQAAETDPLSPFYGAAMLNVWAARQVIVIKRGTGTGFMQTSNELFLNDNSLMLYGNAKTVLLQLATLF